MAHTTRSSSNFQISWDRISVILSVVSFPGSIWKFINDEFPTWIATISIILLLAALLYLARRRLHDLLKSIHPHVANANPWMAIVLLGMTTLILWHVWPSKTAICLSFDKQAAIFNSWQHQNHNKRIKALGSGDTFAWMTVDQGRTASFRFAVDPALPASEGASSGGYVTFYGNVCDRLRYRTVRFRCKVTDVNGNPDVGLRLSVDNPKLTGDRELITYEIESLAKYGPIDSEWRTFEIPLDEFKQVRFEPPFPPGLDENTINKIVFFVDNRIAEQCKKGLFHFKEFCFRQ